MVNSLYLRLNLSAILILLIFLAATGAVLDNAFVESARSSLRERMLGQIYQLLTVSVIEETGQLIMPLPTHLPYSQLALPDSGLYAFIGNNSTDNLLWRSPSLNNQQPPQPPALQVGEKHWADVRMKDGKAYYLLGFGFQRTVKTGVYPFNFYLLAELAPLHKEVRLYRSRLWAGLAGVALLLLATQTWVLYWGLNPLRKVGLELRAIEAEERNQINGRYPREVKQLTDNINILLAQERARQTRYRNALADLAHSLKTPLAVLLGATDQPEALPDTVHEQSTRMMRIVERQLQRAGAASNSAAMPPIGVYQVVERISASLCKVYRHKNVTLSNQIDPSLQFRCDEADLMEILGNLLDNACKWCRSQVEILGFNDGKCLIISVHDDGPGISQEDLAHILQRGGRADESTPGNGLGLSVVADIVESYQGQLIIETNTLGGGVVTIEFGRNG
ncbi:MAG: ATP-binding protein [Methylovulum sp.]|nr:ATP-binding protein [Methylovulum sp.]